MEMQMQKLSYQYPNIKEDDDIDSFFKSNKSKANMKENLEAIKNNIDKKIISITKLQELIYAEELELKKYFVEEKELIACMEKFSVSIPNSF